MQLIDGRAVYSATDLVGFLACEHLTNLETRRPRGARDAADARRTRSWIGSPQARARSTRSGSWRACAAEAVTAIVLDINA